MIACPIPHDALEEKKALRVIFGPGGRTENVRSVIGRSLQRIFGEFQTIHFHFEDADPRGCIKITITTTGDDRKTCCESLTGGIKSSHELANVKGILIIENITPDHATVSFHPIEGT